MFKHVMSSILFAAIVTPTSLFALGTLRDYYQSKHQAAASYNPAAPECPESVKALIVCDTDQECVEAAEDLGIKFNCSYPEEI